MRNQCEGNGRAQPANEAALLEKAGWAFMEVCQLHNEAPPLFVDLSAAAAARPRLHNDHLQPIESMKKKKKQ